MHRVLHISANVTNHFRNGVTNTAVDDASRFRTLRGYSRHTAKYTIGFLERMIDEMFYVLKCTQTD